jgi:hypothetical protein
MHGKRHIKVVLWLVVISMTGQLIRAGEPVIPWPAVAGKHVYALPRPPVSGEEIHLVSDRSIYGIGEEICFSSAYLPPAGFEEKGWSTVLYVELVQWDGTSVARTKACIDNNLASGVLDIPPGIPSGNYYLKAYTRWMRNYSPAGYRYLMVKVVNPLDKAVVPGPEKYSDIPVDDQPEEPEIPSIFRISGLHEQYGRKEVVEFQLDLKDSTRGGIYCISIAKTASASSGTLGGARSMEFGETGSDRVEYLPEISGLSLSGQVIREDGTPVPYTRVQLSTYADPLLFSEVVTGNDGTFLFTLPRDRTSPELHIAETSGSDQDHRILLGTEYCNRPVTLPYIPFLLKDREKQPVRETLLNAQLRERYADAFGFVPDTAGHEQSFYGNNVRVIQIGEFIELKDIRECIAEIIPGVTVRTREGKSGLVVHGPDCQEFYPPLVLMDNIPVPNDDRLLGVPGFRIERIEVVGSGYMIGNFRYSGIFSIFSREQDMAGVSLEGDHHFFNYGLMPENDGQCTACLVPPARTGVPDIRNLLLWEPAVRMDPTSARKICFTTPDAGGVYVVSVRRLEPDGAPGIAGQAVFSVE